jgi:DNA-binding transcriptional regulator LsrR (DeoR family)
VCTVFLRADGTWEDVPLNARATGPSPADLQHIPRRVCVAAGDGKIVPLLAALRAGTVTDLVVDELTATGLLDLVRAQQPRNGVIEPAR